MLAAQAKNRCEKPVAPDEPFVLIVAASGGPRISALNEAAEDLGLTIGEPLADARAKAGFLQVRAAEPTADDIALQKLATLRLPRRGARTTAPTVFSSTSQVRRIFSAAKAN
jgi:hypothetical protein